MDPVLFSLAGRRVAASDLVLVLEVSMVGLADYRRFIKDNRRRLRPGGSKGNIPEPGSRSRGTTEELPICVVALTFHDPPAQSRPCFVIGRDASRCDVVCAKETVSSEHFKLGFEYDHLVLSDVSPRGSKIYIDGCGNHRTWPTPDKPYKCFLPPGADTVITIPGYEFRFTAQPRAGFELSEFRRKRDAFLATTSPIGALNIASKIPTKVPSVVQPPPEPGSRIKHIYWTESKLGRGGQGEVRQVRRLEDWAPFAAKRVLKSTERSPQPSFGPDNESDNDHDRLKQEMTTLQALKHQHIVQYVDWYKDGKDRWHLIMELCPLGSLQTMLTNSTSAFSRLMIAEVLQQVASGLSYLHGEGIAHRDLKPGNILVRRLKPLSLALCDFGLAKQSVRDDGAMSTHCGTRPFMAPEMWTGGRYTKEVDIWALGIVGALLLRVWFPSLSPGEASQYPKLIREGVGAMRNADRSDEVVALVARMLAWDPRDRPSAKACLKDANGLLAKLGRQPQTAAAPGLSGAAPRSSSYSSSSSITAVPPPLPPGKNTSTSYGGTSFPSTEVRAMERELQASAMRQHASHRRGTTALPPPLPPGTSTSTTSYAGTSFPSTEIRAMERELQSSALRQLASHKRDTTALPRSNSMEAPAPKQVRTAHNGPPPLARGPRPGNYPSDYAQSEPVTQIRRDATTVTSRANLPPMPPQNGPGVARGIGPGVGPGVGPGSGRGVGFSVEPGIGPGSGRGVGPGVGPGVGRGVGPGVVPGVGRGVGPGYGPGNGPGYGPGNGPGVGRGAGSGTGHEIGRHDENTIRGNTVRGNGGRGNVGQNGSGNVNGDGGQRNEPQRESSGGWFSSSRVRVRGPISSSIVSEEE